jgi:cold shock CspA family protein
LHPPGKPESLRTAHFPDVQVPVFFAHGSKDAFVHISAVEKAGAGQLREGQKVEYELVAGENGRSSAENLKMLD